MMSKLHTANWSDAVQAGGSILLGTGGSLWCVAGEQLVAAGLMLTAVALLAVSNRAAELIH